MEVLDLMLPYLEKLPYWEYVALGLASLGSLVVVMTSLVALTPSKKDDELLEKAKASGLWSKVMDALKRFSLVDSKKP